MNFPDEFNFDVYKKQNNLEHLSLSKLLEHYNLYGRNGGLISNEIKNRRDFINLIPKKGAILEIGPLASPSMDINSSNVKTLDYFSQEELKENYRDDPNVDINNICKVDYVLKWNNKYTDIIPNKFNYCVSSHNIDHVPCLITFLKNVSSVLINNSYFFLCIPDYRYCYDHFRNPSNIFEVLNNYYTKQDKPSAVSILETRYAKRNCSNDPNEHWDTLNQSKQNLFVSINENINYLHNNKDKLILDIKNIKKVFEDEQNIYIDSHCWKFTPFIFRNILEILFETNYIDFQVERIYKTLKNSNEFYVILHKI
jgi:hypothetical protein